MSKPFDASPKALLQHWPADWPAFFGVRAKSVEVVDTDLSTVTAATDKALLVHGEDGDRIQHYDFQSGPDRKLPRRAHRYNALLEYLYDLPVESIVLLLSPKANLRRINGEHERKLPGESNSYLQFRYRVIRVWELPVDSILSAGVSILPLAPISKVQRRRLPDVIERMKERFASIEDNSEVGELWTATKVLMGLRYDKVSTDHLLRGVRGMKESVTYQAIVEEGVEKGIQQGVQMGKTQKALHMLLRIGSDRFNGPPTSRQLQQLEAMTDDEYLEELGVRALHVRGWSELLGAAEAPRPARRKKS